MLNNQAYVIKDGRFLVPEGSRWDGKQWVDKNGDKVSVRLLSKEEIAKYLEESAHKQPIEDNYSESIGRRR